MIGAPAFQYLAPLSNFQMQPQPWFGRIVTQIHDRTLEFVIFVAVMGTLIGLAAGTTWHMHARIALGATGVLLLGLAYCSFKDRMTLEDFIRKLLVADGRELTYEITDRTRTEVIDRGLVAKVTKIRAIDGTIGYLVRTPNGYLRVERVAGNRSVRVQIFNMMGVPATSYIPLSFRAIEEGNAVYDNLMQWYMMNQMPHNAGLRPRIADHDNERGAVVGRAKINYTASKMVNTTPLEIWMYRLIGHRGLRIESDANQYPKGDIFIQKRAAPIIMYEGGYLVRIKDREGDQSFLRIYLIEDTITVEYITSAGNETGQFTLSVSAGDKDPNYERIRAIFEGIGDFSIATDEPGRSPPLAGSSLQNSFASGR